MSDDRVSQREKVKEGRTISDTLQATLSGLVVDHIDGLDHNLTSLVEAVKDSKYDDGELKFQVSAVGSHIEASFRSLAQEITAAVQNTNEEAHDDFTKQVEQLKRNNGDLSLAITRFNEMTKENSERILKNLAEQVPQPIPQPAPDTAKAVAVAEAELKAKNEKIEKLQAALAIMESQSSSGDAEYWKKCAQDFEESLSLQNDICKQQEVVLAKNENDIQVFAARYRKMVEELAAAKGNIRIICRIKPEDVAEDEMIKFTNTDGEHPFLPWSNLRATYLNESNRVENRDFDFQRVFGIGEDNEAIFSEVKDFARSAALGNACTIMAYGATGTGKSHTFLSEDGLVNSSIGLLFDLADEESDHYEYKFYLSITEIYLNKVFDLLQPSIGGRKVEVKLGGESNMKLGSRAETIEFIKRAVDSREAASTRQNNTSSRSHFIISVRVERKSITDTSETPTTGIMALLDLSGSESIGRNLSSANPTIEEALIYQQGRDINAGLLDLGKSIRSVATGGKFFPGHNLTRYLRSSLTQASRLLVVATVSPLLTNRASTMGTLRWCQDAVGRPATNAASRGASPRRGVSSSRNAHPVRNPVSSGTPRTPGRDTNNA
ncbi:hypothetical protein EKO27_g1356 [Xylaria grammica]|uniref:Kinesin motor domain-containing protein n=1 Tax=Xylaria grammica TaxID=363999 RepID=A0A439DH90_9PEZI|nr:hypothetical protein EKO27_g1356 [Xylaria grammica]